jgi:DNA-directed RNA polymerase subunit RPC12/RpoP
MTTYIYYCLACQQLSENETGEDYITCPHCGGRAKRTATKETKTFYTAWTTGKKNPATQTVIIYASSLKAAHAAAREHFGKGVSFSTREATHQETLHVEPSEVINTQ